MILSYPYKTAKSRKRRTDIALNLKGRIENVGEGNARDVRILLDSELEGNKIAYLGKIERDDDEPTIFTLKANKGGEIINKIKLTYKDDFGEHEFIEEFPLKIYQNKKSSISTILVILVVVVGLTYYFFFVKKKKGKKE